MMLLQIPLFSVHLKRIRITLDKDLDPTFYSETNPDPAPHQSDANHPPLVYRLYRLRFNSEPPHLNWERQRLSKAPF